MVTPHQPVTGNGSSCIASWLKLKHIVLSRILPQHEAQRLPCMMLPFLQEHSVCRDIIPTGEPESPVNSEREWQQLHSQLAQTEAALRAEQHSCSLLREQAEERQGYAVQAQVQLQRSHSRAERLAALVNQTERQRKG